MAADSAPFVKRFDYTEDWEEQVQEYIQSLIQSRSEAIVQEINVFERVEFMVSFGWFFQFQNKT